MFQTISSFIKNNLKLLIILVTGLILVFLFHEILKPFIIAIIVAYIIEPLVKRMNKLKIRNHHIPRGVAVIVAYLLFLLAVTGVGFAFIPSLTSEISRATDDIPKYFSKLKDEDIPRWSKNIDHLLNTFSPGSANKNADNAQQKSGDAVDPDAEDPDQGTMPKVDTSGQKPLLIHGDRPPSTKELVEAAKEAENAQPPVLFRFKEVSKGAYEIQPGDSDIILHQTEPGKYVLKSNEEKNNLQGTGSFDLNKELSKAAVELVESSTKYAGSALSILQYTISFIVDMFVQLILVFMLAAFISIDSPKLMTSVRKLFEDKNGEAKLYDQYKERLLKGLSGVVQGQIIICCINGTLTGIGLYIFGVDYALLLGIIAGVLSIVPIFGTIISTIPAVLLGLVNGGPFTALLVLGWILAVHFCDTNFFTPKIVGSSSNLHPVVIIFALLAGQQVAGILGLILAVPTTSILVTSIRFILDHAQSQKPFDPTITLSNIQISQDGAAILSPVTDQPIAAYASIQDVQDNTVILAPETDPFADTISTEITTPDIIPSHRTISSLLQSLENAQTKKQTQSDEVPDPSENTPASPHKTKPDDKTTADPVPEDDSNPE